MSSQSGPRCRQSLPNGTQSGPLVPKSDPRNLAGGAPRTAKATPETPAGVDKSTVGAQGTTLRRKRRPQGLGKQKENATKSIDVAPQRNATIFEH